MGTNGRGAPRDGERAGRVSHLGGGAAFVVDHDLRCLIGEGDALRLAGIEPGDMAGRPMIDILDPELAARLEPECRLALAGTPGVREHAAGEHAYLTRSIPLHDPGGAIYAALLVSFDLTPARRAASVVAAVAARDRLLVALADAIRPLTAAADIAAAASTLTRMELGATRVSYLDVDVASGRRRLADLGPEILGVLERREPIVIDDVAGDPRLDGSRAGLAAASVGALIAQPLSKAGRLLSVFVVEHAGPRQWRPDEIALVEAVAERTCTAVEHARAETGLRDSEARLKLALEASGMGSFIWRLDEAHGDADARALELFGLGNTEGSPFEMLDRVVHPEDRPRLESAVVHALEPSGPGMILEDVRVMRPDGGVRWVSITARTEFAGRPSRAVRVVGLAGDVTARKHSEAGGRERESQLRRADRRKDEFLATLAHELRNPLAPIRVGLEIIRLGGDSVAAVERVRVMMERQVGQMVRLIDDLLDVSRITSGKIQLQRQPTALSALLAPVLDAHRAAIMSGGLALDLQLPEAPLAVDVDATRAVQVLSNVLQNAVKFTDPGGLIRMSAIVEPALGAGPAGLLAITISDSGIGIAPELAPRIFDLFSQGGTVVGRPHGGLGIGLALARQLIEMQGGSISVHSDGPGRGSAFTIRLPLAEQPEEPFQVDAPMASMARRVVVIDDNEDAAAVTAMLVRELGGEARVAHDGAQGVTEVLAWRPDTVLLDIGMPGMDGYEACRQIRRALGRSVTIVALSGWGQPRDKQEAMQAGFDVHLTKPADPAELARLLRDPPRPD